MILLGMVASSSYGLIDSLLALVAEDNNRNFSSIRVFGSMAYMTGAFISGYIARYFGYTILFSIAACLFIVVSVLYMLLKAPVSNKKENEKVQIKKLFINKNYVFYLFFYIFFIGSMQVGDDYFSLYLVNKGCEQYIYSTVMFGFIFIECLVMFLLNRFGKKINNKYLFLVAVLLLLLKLLGNAIPSTPVWLIICLALSRGITWGITLHISSQYVVRTLGFSSATQGIMLITLGTSIYTSLFKLFGGTIIDAIGFNWFYTILLIIVGITLPYYLLFVYPKFKKKDETIDNTKIKDEITSNTAL